MKTVVAALVVVGLMASPAFAFRCPLLVKQVNDETALSFDVEVSSRPESTAIAARGLAVEATARHESGQHDQAVAKMEEAFTLVGLAFVKP